MIRTVPLPLDYVHLMDLGIFWISAVRPARGGRTRFTQHLLLDAETFSRSSLMPRQNFDVSTVSSSYLTLSSELYVFFLV